MKTLDSDGNGKISLEEFIEGALRSRGPILSKHLLELECDISRVDAEISEIMKILLRAQEDSVRQKKLDDLAARSSTSLRRCVYRSPCSTEEHKHLA